MHYVHVYIVSLNLRLQDSVEPNFCAPILFLYALNQRCEENRPFPGSSKGQVSASVFEDHRLLKRANLTIVHNSQSIGVGPDVALFRKLEDYELSDKVFVLEGRHYQVT